MHSLALRRRVVSVWPRILGILLFAVATAVSTRVSVPLPFSPVPLTLQVLVVILSGFMLGARNGLIAQCLYLQLILLGASPTAAGLTGPAALASPTAGYLLAFPLAAALAGWLSHHSVSFKPLWRGVGGIVAVGSIYALGTLWLSGFVGGLGNAWKLGALPFVAADALKVAIAAAAVSLRDR